MLGFCRRPARARQPADHTTHARTVLRGMPGAGCGSGPGAKQRPGSHRPASRETGLYKSWQWPIFRARLPGEYRRRCGVSLPCSGWERVVPPRSNHQLANQLSTIGQSTWAPVLPMGQPLDSHLPWRVLRVAIKQATEESIRHPNDHPHRIEETSDVGTGT